MIAGGLDPNESGKNILGKVKKIVFLLLENFATL